jgi:hypothetical protein
MADGICLLPRGLNLYLRLLFSESIVSKRNNWEACWARQRFSLFAKIAVDVCYIAGR